MNSMMLHVKHRRMDEAYDPEVKGACGCESKGRRRKDYDRGEPGHRPRLAERPTLLVDLDPQGNATTGLGVPKAGLYPTVYHALLGSEAVEKAIRPTLVPKLMLLPSDIDLVGAEIELVALDEREFRLKHAMAPII